MISTSNSTRRIRQLLFTLLTVEKQKTKLWHSINRVTRYSLWSLIVKAAAEERNTVEETQI